MIDLTLLEGFEWDEGNARKNDKHDVTASEAEQIFFNQPLLMLEDARHSQTEPRFHTLGITHTGRKLTTFRSTKNRAGIANGKGNQPPRTRA